MEFFSNRAAAGIPSFHFPFSASFPSYPPTPIYLTKYPQKIKIYIPNPKKKNHFHPIHPILSQKPSTPPISPLFQTNTKNPPLPLSIYHHPPPTFPASSTTLSTCPPPPFPTSLSTARNDVVTSFLRGRFVLAAQ